MEHKWWSVISPVVGLILNVIAQILGYRYINRLSLLRSVYFGFGLGLFGMILFDVRIVMAGYFASTIDALAVEVTNVVIFSCLGYCYFSAIGMGEHARRIRIMKELAIAPRGLTLKEILSRYNAKDMIKLRLGRLIRSGQVIEKDERYFIGKPIMLFLTNLSIMMKKLVIGKSSEFD